MDSSDEELFTPTPSSSITITSLSLSSVTSLEQINDLESYTGSYMEKDCNDLPIRNISVNLTRLPDAKLEKNLMNKHSPIKATRRRRNKWKDGNFYKRRKQHRKSTEKTYEEIKPAIQTTSKSLENTVDENLRSHLHKQSYNVEEKLYTNVQQNVQDAQTDTENIFSSIREVQNKEEDPGSDETNVCARILPYESHLEYSLASSNNVIDVVTCSDSSSLLSSNSGNTEHGSISEKTYKSKNALSRNKEKMSKKLLDEKLNLMAEEIAKKKKLIDEWKFKRKRVSSDDESLNSQSMKKHRRRISSNESLNLQSMKRRRRRISSSESNISETIASKSTEVIEDSNRSESHSFFESTVQEKSSVNIRIREARITLKKLEDDTDIVKWREYKTENASEIIVPKQQLKQQPNQIALQDRSNSSLKTNSIPEILSKLSTVSTTNDVKRSPTNSDYLLNMMKLRKEYKLFKKPRVLMIKLETLPYSPKNGRYSATEIDCLTRKYINFVISITSSSNTHRPLFYQFAQSPKRKTTDTSVARAEDDNTSPGVCRRQSVSKILDLSSEQLDAEEGLIKDNEVTDTSTNEDAPFRIKRLNFMSKRLKFMSDQNRMSPRKVKMEVWRTAFCGPEKKSTEKSASAQSTSEVLSISKSSSKKPEYESVSDPLTSTSTSSTEYYTQVESQLDLDSTEKLVSSKKQTKASTKSIKSNEASELESISNTNPSSNASVEETVSKSPQSKGGAISKSPHKDATKENVIASDSSLNSSKKVLEKVLSKSRPSCREVPTIHKCIKCLMSFENFQLLQEHRNIGPCKICATMNALSGNASKRVGPSGSEQGVEKIYRSNSDILKLSASQRFSTDKEGDSRKSVQSLVGSDKEIVLSSSSPSRSSGSEHLRKPQIRNTLIKSKSDLDLFLQQKEGVTEPRSHLLLSGKQIKCKTCLQKFDTYLQLKQHTLKHTENNLQNAQTPIKNKTAFTYRQTNENNIHISANRVEKPVQVEKVRIETEVSRNDSNEHGKGSVAATSESNAKSPVVSQQNATKERKKTLNLPETEHTVTPDSDEQLTSATINAENKTDEVQCAQAKEIHAVASSSASQVLTKPITICECHKLVPVNENCAQIEIVLLCNSCQTLFRRNDCFDQHCQRPADGMYCSKFRRDDRMPKTLCVGCRQILDSVKEMWGHVEMHCRRNHTVNFFCNICKVIFHGFGTLFKDHFHHHLMNPYFMASRLSFPSHNYLDLQLIEPNSVNPETYMQVADYVCRECRQIFIIEATLKSHKAVCKKKVETDKHNDDSASSGDKSTTSAAPMKILLTCGFCNKIFYTRASFDLHSLDHKQKRELNLNYTCVYVTAITKVYICKVCTTMWKSKKDFHKHWLTHGILQEVYVCSRCQNHYDNIDTFQEHAITHVTAGNPQKAICKVVYRDITYRDINNQSSELDQHIAVYDNGLPRTSRSCFNSKGSNGNITNDKTRDPKRSSTTSVSQDSIPQDILLKNKQTAIVGAMVLPESLRSNKETHVSNGVGSAQIPEGILTDAAVTQSKCTLKNDKSSNSNTENLDNSEEEEEEELVILVSESEESSMSSEAKKVESIKTNNAPSVKCKDAQENAITTSDLVTVTDRQEQCSKDAAPPVTSAPTSNDASKSLDSNTEVNVTTSRESVTQLNANVNVPQDNEILVSDMNVESSTTMITTTTTTITTTRTMREDRASNISADCSTSSASSPKEKLKQPLPRDAMSSVPKSFLRVKSLAELTSTSPMQNHLCHVCGLSFETAQKLSDHILMHNSQLTARQVEQNVQTSSANNTQRWPSKPEFNPSLHMPSQDALPQNQDHSSSVIINNTPSPGNIRQHIPNGVDNANSRQYQATGMRPLHSVRHSMTKNKMPNEYGVGTPWMPPLNLAAGTQTRLQPQPQPQSQSQTQRPIYHQNLPSIQPRMSYSANRSVPSVHQSTGTVAVRPFMQSTYQPSRPSPPAYPEQQRSLPSVYPQQQQQQPQQQQANVDQNILNCMLSKGSVSSYHLALNDAMDNGMYLIGDTMQQMSINPDRYNCSFCPGFECSSVQEFVLHEHSSKHEARSHYNGVSMPRT